MQHSWPTKRDSKRLRHQCALRKVFDGIAADQRCWGTYCQIVYSSQLKSIGKSLLKLLFFLLSGRLLAKETVLFNLPSNMYLIDKQQHKLCKVVLCLLMCLLIVTSISNNLHLTYSNYSIQISWSAARNRGDQLSGDSMNDSN